MKISCRKLCSQRPGHSAQGCAAAMGALLVLLQGCSTVDGSAPHPEPRSVTATAPAGQPADAHGRTGPGVSQARTPKDYRQDAARHIYAQQAHKVFRGRLPPMLHAVGVLHVDIDRRGLVQALHWQRAPRHAPEVMAEIEKMVRAAAPYPLPQHMAGVTYTDIWLWHKSGRFQLDTLTEGQD